MKVIQIPLTDFEIKKLVEAIDIYFINHRCNFLKETRKSLVDEYNKIFMFKILK